LRSEQIVLLSGGSLAGNADLRMEADGSWVIQGDPTEAAFLVAERKLGTHERRGTRFERVGEIPFTSDRKMMSTLVIDHEQADERLLISKGAPDVLLGHCTRIRVGMDVLPMTDALRARALGDVEALSDQALRTLSVAYRPLARDESTQAGEALEHDLIFVGTVGIIDPPRAEAAPAIDEAHRAGIRVIMITGDHPRTAARIAADLGIIEAGGSTLTGADLDALNDAELGEAVKTTSVYARVAPVHKLRIVDALQAQGHVVAMTGDGVNDAPALKSADIGIAMGITGTEVTKAAGKMILADDNFATIVAAVREGRGLLDNIRKFLRYLLSSNMGEVLTVFLGVVGAGVIGLTDSGGAVVLPLLATQILWINLITDSGPALAMGVDAHSDDVMRRQPRRPDERIIDRRDVVRRDPARTRHGAGDPADAGHPAARRHCCRRSRPGHGAYRSIHRAGAGAAVQRLQCPLRTGECVPRGVRQPMALGFGRARSGASGRRGGTALSEPRLRYGAARHGSVAAVCRDGQPRDVVQRTAQAPAARDDDHQGHIEGRRNRTFLPADNIFRDILHGIRTQADQRRCRQSGVVSGSARAAVPGAGVLHCRCDGRADSQGKHHALARAHDGGACVLPGRRAGGFPDRGVLVHHRAAVCRHLSQGRRHRPGHHLPVLRAGRQHHGAGLHRQHPRPGFRPLRASCCACCSASASAC
jgi:phosphoserine phosphatase